MNTERSRTSDRSGALRVPTLLVLASPSADSDDFLSTVVARTDLTLLMVANVSGAEVALRDIAVSLVLVSPETDAETVTAVLDRTEELRRGTPSLVLRPRGEEPLAAWKGRTVGILQGPVSPEVLNRTVDVALGLRARP